MSTRMLRALGDVLGFGCMVVVLPACGQDGQDVRNPCGTEGGVPCDVIATGQTRPGQVIVSGSEVFWINTGDAQIVRGALGTPPQLLAQEEAVGVLAYYNARLYWTGDRGTIRTCASTGGPVSELDTQLSGAHIAVDATGIYIADELNEWISRVDLDGANLVVLWPGPGAISPYVIAVDDTSVYWVDFFAAPTLNRVAKAGSEREVLAAGDIVGVPLMAIDETHVYWTNQQNGTIVRIPKEGGAPTLIATDLRQPLGLAVAGPNVYWTDFQTDMILGVAKEGGEPFLVAENQRSAIYLAAGDTALYWTVRDAGDVRSTPLW